MQLAPFFVIVLFLNSSKGEQLQNVIGFVAHCVNKLANMDLQSLFSDFAADLKWMNLTAFSYSEHVVLLTSQHEQ